MQKKEKIVTSEAYILFYCKMSNDNICRQTLEKSHLWPHFLNNDLTERDSRILETLKSVVVDTNYRISSSEESKFKSGVNIGSPRRKTSKITVIKENNNLKLSPSLLLPPSRQRGNRLKLKKKPKSQMDSKRNHPVFPKKIYDLAAKCQPKEMKNVSTTL